MPLRSLSCCDAILPTCEHALDWLGGELLCDSKLPHSHGLLEDNIAVDDGRAHVAGAVALDPTLGETTGAARADTGRIQAYTKFSTAQNSTPWCRTSGNSRTTIACMYGSKLD
jgi:hypothetical protein